MSGPKEGRRSRDVLPVWNALGESHQLKAWTRAGCSSLRRVEDDQNSRASGECNLHNDGRLCKSGGEVVCELTDNAM